MDNKLIVLVLGILLFFYLLQMNHTTLTGYNLNLKNDINPTNIGFVKPEHRLLKVLNTISADWYRINQWIYGENGHIYVIGRSTSDNSMGNIVK